MEATSRTTSPTAAGTRTLGQVCCRGGLLVSPGGRQGLEEQPLPRLLSECCGANVPGELYRSGRPRCPSAACRCRGRTSPPPARGSRRRRGGAFWAPRGVALAGRLGAAGVLVHRPVAAVLRRALVGALVARVADRVVGEIRPKWASYSPVVRRLGDDREAALDDVRVDDQDLLDAVEVLDDDLAGRDQVVDQLAELDLVLLEEGPQLVGGGRAGVDDLAQVVVARRPGCR